MDRTSSMVDEVVLVIVFTKSVFLSIVLFPEHIYVYFSYGGYHNFPADLK